MNSKGQITIKFPDEDVWEEWISFCKKNGKRHGVYGGVLLQRAVVKYMNKEKRLQIIEENKERNLLGLEPKKIGGARKISKEKMHELFESFLEKHGLDYEDE